MTPGPPEQGLLSRRLDAVTRGRQSRARRQAARGGRSPLTHWLLARPPADPLPSVTGVLDGPEAGRYGVCCSGGGIRSAAFNLGALQTLQAPEHRVLQRATYLAAVSGGSYMAAGFAMVAKIDGPEASDPELVDDEHPAFAPGSPEEQFLRNRCSYMAPGIGGKARLLARVVLGLLINLLLLGSVLLVVGWLLGSAVFGELLYPGLRKADGEAATTPGLWVAVGVAAGGTLLGLAGMLLRFGSDSPTRFLHAWCGRLLVAAAALALVLVAFPELIEWLREVPAASGDTTAQSTAAELGGVTTLAAVGGSSALTVLSGVLLQLRVRMQESRVLAGAVSSGRRNVSGMAGRLLPRLRGILATVAMAIAGPLLVLGLLLGATLLGVVDEDLDGWTLPVLGAAIVFVAGMSLAGDVTSWSLHPFYRRRLATAFALRRVRGEGGTPIAVERAYDRRIPLSETGVVEPVTAQERPREWPQLIVCAAANVSDPGATPPGRAVSSFTFSPSVIGGPLIGTVATAAFEGRLTSRRRDFTLPAAVAMSGAALSPSMGKQTRGPLRFLMTLGNARLGVWVPNPRRFTAAEDEPPEGERSWLNRRLRELTWRPRPILLVNELLGRNSADARFLYVTDGGHYENLGLVELLRRGCLDVLCFDASGGRDTQELGDAIALARSELGVEVDLPADAGAALVPGPDGVAKADCATGTIRYPTGETGTLVYVRSVLTRDAPHDVRAYHEREPTFPHDSTGNQLYSDQRFEAYRVLGRGAAERALALYRAHGATHPDA